MFATVTVSITVNTADDVDVVSRILRAGLGSATEIRVEPAAAPAPVVAAPAPVEPPVDTSKLPRKKAKPAVTVEPATPAPEPATPAPEPVVEVAPEPVAVEAVKPEPAKPAPALNQVSLDDVKGAVRARIEAKGIEDVKRIFEAHGGAKLSDFAVDAYWSLVTDLREGL